MTSGGRRGATPRSAPRPRPALDRRGRFEWWATYVVRRAYLTLSFPLAVYFLLSSPRIRPEYGLTWRKRYRLGYRLWRNNARIHTGTSFKAHLAMAVKLLEMDPATEGVVVECGSYYGGSTANLSLICDLVDRRLIVYDSFEGLPAPRPGDTLPAEVAGEFCGDLETVRSNVEQFGSIERCELRPGWFADTLPLHAEPIALAFLDVDLRSSLHDCVLNLWPHVVRGGHVFVDEFVYTDYCALFYSERWWRTYFDTTPPGLYGAGSGIGLGQYWVGPVAIVPAQSPTTIAYTTKGNSGLWQYYPDDDDGDDEVAEGER